MYSKALSVVFAALLAPAAYGSNCARTSVGFTPLNGPFFVRPYQGFPGGLYPNGANKRPPDHEAAGLRLAADVRPRDASGNPDDQNGRIVLLSIGMSNATQEFSAFKPLADRDPDKNPRLVIVDGAQGGWSADRIVGPMGAEYWATVMQRLRAAGVTAAQVQAAWMKDADPSPTKPFPDHARQLQSELQQMAQTARSMFPNLRLLYHSSRIYAGYASSNLNPEPFAYESGFSVKWLIEKQIQGDADVSFAVGKVPWMAWGPYLWADGTTPRFDGLVWSCSDLEDDGTHPNRAGQQKVAGMLLDFFKSDTTTRPWFVRAAQPPPVPVAAALVNAASFSAAIAAGSIASLFGTELASSTASASTLPLPTALAGAGVEIGGQPALLSYVSPRQINLIVPEAPADGSVTVIRNGVRSSSIAAQMTIFAPGIFTLDSAGRGPAAAIHADGRIIGERQPAQLGETIAIFATGFGVRNPLSLRPDFLPIVRIGGVNAEITFSGPAPGFPGLNQVNATVPSNAPVGPAVSLELQLATSVSNTATLAVAAP